MNETNTEKENWQEDNRERTQIHPHTNTYIHRLERERERERKICVFCNRNVDNSKRICSVCIDERRPTLSKGLYIFLSILLILPGSAYKNYIENKQQEWDIKNL